MWDVGRRRLVLGRPQETMGDHAQTTAVATGADLGFGGVRTVLGDHGRPWETMLKLWILESEGYTPALEAI